jgi:UDP-N-acetylglucosamine--N-acetylmuramyl-(pentapeptide) pyrophosphoryl-undecaprenol N-acetylglucosamine transferase
MKTDSASISPEILWVGGEGGMEADLVKREGVRFEEISSAGLHGVGLRALPGNLIRTCRGFYESLRILRSYRPDVLFFTGGYVAVPMAFASWLGRYGRRLLYVPDIEPGLALQTLARFADDIVLTTDASKAYFPGKSNLTIVGYPLRPGLDRWTRQEALKIFDLREDLPVLLVSGGSKGARSINRAVSAILPRLLESMQVLHISGQLDSTEMQQVQQGLPEKLAVNYRLFSYLHDEMGAALRVADLAVMRAGASTLGELPLFGLPAILVPYPYAWRYQKVNAAYLVECGAAELLEDAELSEKLLPRVSSLMSDPVRRLNMKSALQGLARPAAAAQIADRLFKLAAYSNQASG